MSEVSFTKLFSTITDSTIWDESPEICKVWITMLAMADQNGYVGASIPGLANRSRVPIAVVEAALERFMSPDPYSRTRDNEGRRIEETDRGWFLLNHPRFRDRTSEEKERDRKREWARKNREREENSDNSTIANVANVDATFATGVYGTATTALSSVSVSVSKDQKVVPRDLDTALAIPIDERAQHLVDNPHKAEWLQPHRWPEVVKIAEDFSKSLGWHRPKFAKPSKATARIVELLATYSTDQLEKAVENAPKNDWLSSGGKSLTALTVDVVGQLLNFSTENRQQDKREAVLSP